MAKISKTFDQNEEKNGQLNNEQPKNLASISKKIESEPNPNSIINVQEQNIPSENINIAKNLTIEDLAHWLIDNLGENLFKNLKNNPNFSIPYAEENITIVEWLQRAIKTIFTLEDLQLALQHLQNKINNSTKNFNDITSQLNIELDRNKKELAALKEDLEIAQAKKNKAEKKVKSAIPGTILLDIIFGENKDTASIRQQLEIALEQPTDGTMDFITGFAQGWIALNNALNKCTDDEIQNIDTIQKALRILLQKISGKHIAERRTLLDATANYINKLFTNFEFISPEQSLQVDPSIHNAKGVGGSRIKEGISFAVIRKANRQTYQFAEIVV